jgi:hypothetical protein
MSDGRQPRTAAYLARRAAAQRLRPSSAQARMTPEEFAAYREAVHLLTRAFDDAEAEAWRHARAHGTIPPGQDADPEPAGWVSVAQSVAQTVIATSADAISRAAASVRAASADAARPEAPPHADTADAPTAGTAPPSPVWPVPSRTDGRDRRDSPDPG